MLSLERVQYIMDSLKESKVVYVKDLAKKFYLSESTIRRDLVALEREGLIRRVYGGAMLLNRTKSEVPYEVRAVTDLGAKSHIGMLAARLVKDEMVVFLDTSSTTGEMIQYLKGKKNLRIITNSAYLSLRMLEHLDAEIICLGGRLNPYSRGFVGENAVHNAELWYADLCFFSSRCVSLSHGCMDNNDEEASIKKTMMRQSRQSVFLCDSSKFDKTSVRYLAQLSELDCMITEKNPGDAWIRELEKNNVELIYS